MPQLAEKKLAPSQEDRLFVTCLRDAVHESLDPRAFTLTLRKAGLAEHAQLLEDLRHVTKKTTKIIPDRPDQQKWVAAQVRAFMPIARRLVFNGIDHTMSELDIENIVEDELRKDGEFEKALKAVRAGTHVEDVLVDIHCASSLTGFFLGVAYGQCLTPAALELRGSQPLAPKGVAR